jgi:hypothetical protein
MGGAMAGSVVGHGISNMLFGGRGGEAAAAPPPPAEYAEAARAQTGGCDIPAKGEFGVHRHLAQRRPLCLQLPLPKTL